MGVAPAIDLTAEQRRTVLALLSRHLPNTTVWAYGSRAKWTSQPDSDLDLVAFAKPEQAPRIAELREDFDESYLPFSVDLFVWDDVPKEFRKRILAEHVALCRADTIGDGSVWPNVAIGDLAQIVGGGTPSTADPANFDGDVPWLTPRDLSGDHDRRMAYGRRNISRLGLERSSARLVPTGSVLLSTRAPIGYVCLAKNELTMNQGFRALIANALVAPEYLYYWLLSNGQELERHASGSTFKELSGGALAKVKIALPPRAEQERIAAVLGALDDKIELNRRGAEVLESTVRTLFKTQFVDVEGHIPPGWGIKPIGQVCAIFGGSTPSTKIGEYWEGGSHCWATPKDLAGQSTSVLIGTARRITDAGLDQIRSGLLPRGTVLMSSRAPIGYLAITDVPVCVNQGFIAMVPNQGMSSSYLLNWCHFNQDKILSVANGSTFLEVAKRNFRTLDVLVPTEQKLAAFDGLSEVVYRRIALTVRESLALSSLRDILLPKLISRRVRVQDVEELVEAAT